MDSSPGSDGMDWEEDSSLHIIQPASSPWRKRSFDAYNDTNEPYRANDGYSGYQVTDTLHHHPEVVEPFIDFNGRPAPFVRDFDGNVILQPVIQQQPPRRIGDCLPEVVKWLFCGVALLVFATCELADGAYKYSATVAVRAGDSAKRRLVEVTQRILVPAPSPRRRRHGVPPHHRRSPIIRRVSPTLRGGRTHVPVTPPRARPLATLKESALSNHDCVFDYIPSNPKHRRFGAFVSSHEDGHSMSGMTHQPYFEPLMSGALQDIEMSEENQSHVALSFSPYHIPGTYPSPPILPGLSSIESPTALLQVSDELAMPSPYHIPGTFPDPPIPSVSSSIEYPTPESQVSDEIPMPNDRNIHESATLGEQAAEELATPRSEVSDEPDIPDVQPLIRISLQNVDSRPRNYKGELLDEWQLKVCREFQAIHPPPKGTQQQATSVPEQPQEPSPTGLIESHRSPMANVSPITPHQQDWTTATGSIDSGRSPTANISPVTPHQQDWTTGTGSNDSRRSPMANVSPITPHQQDWTTATGSIDSRRSPIANVSPTGTANQKIDLQESTTGRLYQPHNMNSIGSNDLPRSPLDLHRATTEVRHQPRGTASLGSNDLCRSPLADFSSTKTGDSLNSSHDASIGISHQPPETATIGLIDSPRSPLANLSPIDSRREMITTGSIDSPRSPLADASPTQLPPDTSPIGSIDSPRSPLADVSPIYLPLDASPIGSIDSTPSSLGGSPMSAAVVMTDTLKTGINASSVTLNATPVPSESATSSSAKMTMTPSVCPSKWSIRSLYARVQGKPKKRSPLGERVNNANISKVPKTPKKVTWPENGPVTGTKRFIKHEAMSHPSPSSSREDSSILSSVPSDLSPQSSPTMQEEEQEAVLNPPYQTYPPVCPKTNRSISQILSTESDEFTPMSPIERTDAIYKSGEEETTSSSSSSDSDASIHSVETPRKTSAADPSTPPPHLSPNFEDLTISTRRSSLRRREKEDQERKLREAIAAEEKARKEKEDAEEEEARKDKEEAEERARIKAEEEEERKKTGGRRMPIEKVIQSLPPGWDEKVRINMAKGMREQLAMTSVGNPLTRRDFGMVLPQRGTGDDPSGWLNDEIISGYLQAVVDHGHRAMGHPRRAKPRMHAFSPFFYTTLKERGYDAVKRWSTRAKIGGNDLKSVEYVFIPCNPSKSHWTLIVVSPVRKTIEVFDSMHGASLDKVETTKKWLRGELGRSYVDSEWTVVEDPKYQGRGKGPMQNNANDCGVFAVTTAKMLVLGVDPMAVSAVDMPLQRCRLVAELLNGGFSGDFEPRIVFE